MSFFDHPERLTRKNAYFAALNSHRGFVSYFPALFSACPKYIIKGGPGSGKSTLMKKIATAAEEKGYRAERYYCSSDSDSLDAVVIPALQVAILDGTPPHTTEPELPGAFDQIINLTAFWNTKRLQENAASIRALSSEISQSYRRVYTLMQAIATLENAITESTESAFDKEHAEKIVHRLLDKYGIKGKKNGNAAIRPTSAFGVKGYVHLDTDEEEAKTIIQIKDRVVYSEHFFKILKRALSQKGVSFRLSPRPVDEITESLYLPEEGILFTRTPLTSEPDGRINLDRMLPERGRGALSGQKNLLREIDSLCHHVKDLLHQAGKRHDELEAYYIAATDYTALDQYTSELLHKLFA